MKPLKILTTAMVALATLAACAQPTINGVPAKAVEELRILLAERLDKDPSDPAFHDDGLSSLVLLGCERMDEQRSAGTTYAEYRAGDPDYGSEDFELAIFRVAAEHYCPDNQDWLP